MEKRIPFIRYKLILEKLRAGNRPSRRDIQRYLNDKGYSISARGVLRDIAALSSCFAIDVSYDREDNFYYIDNESSPAMSSAVSYLEIAQAADTIIETFKDVKDLSRYVVFEHQGVGKGTEYLPSLLNAIKAEAAVSLWHSTFQDQEEKRYTFAPQLLKQYQGRWYAIGAVPCIDNPMVFGLDRIHRIEAIPDSPRIEWLDLSGFNDVVGVSLPEGKPEVVRLKATALQARYLEALPLHRSQRVVARKPDSVEFSLRVIPNYELIQELLKLSESVQVIAPDALVKKIQEIYKRNLIARHEVS